MLVIERLLALTSADGGHTVATGTQHCPAGEPEFRLRPGRLRCGDPALPQNSSLQRRVFNGSMAALILSW